MPTHPTMDGCPPAQPCWFEGVCLPYYRHPCSAACFPAPSGCRLRPFAELRGARGANSRSSFFIVPKKTPTPKKSSKTGSNLSIIFGKSAHLSPIQYKDLAAQIDVLLYMFLNPYSTVGCSCPTLLLSPCGYSYRGKMRNFCKNGPPATPRPQFYQKISFFV